MSSEDPEDPDAVVRPYTVDALLRLLGKRLREARLRRNMVLDDVARLAETTRKTVAEVEKGSHGTRLEKFIAVFFALGIEDQLAELATLGRECEDLQGEGNPKRARRKSS